MRKMYLLLAAAIMALSACHEKKAEKSEIIKTDYEAPAPTAPKATAVNTITEEVEWVEGRHYQVVIRGMAVDSLPMVKNDNGQEFIDNAIRVEVKRADGTQFFGRTFTKSSFAQWMDGDYQKKAILSSMNFLGKDGAKLLFIASLNYPDAGDDEAIDLQLSLDAQGGISIRPFTYNDRDDLTTSEGRR